MRDKDLYARILGITPPWFVRDVELQLQAGEVIVQLDVDADHYLGLGVDGPVAALFRSNIVFIPTRRGARAASLHKERPIVAGFVFDEAREPLKGAPYLWDEPTGRGHVTLFADDPAFRAFLHGAHRLLLNAILLGPSM